jgi:DNA replication and repair protein RecF
MIRSGRESAIIRARLTNGEKSILAELQLNRVGANRAQVNRSPIKTRELPRYFSSVLFAPEDLALVRGDPAGRRRFLDELLVLRTPRMAGVLADYDRVLRQRNSLLKSARSSGVRANLSTLDIWDERLVALGSEIIDTRAALVDELKPEVSVAYAAIAGSDHSASLASRLSILSSSTDDDEFENLTEPLRGDRLTADQTSRAFADALARLRKSELDRGITLAGPHRDDLQLTLNDLPARGYASHGESWSFALSLKLAAAAVLRRESSAGDPVLILDDVFAELDESRRGRLASAVETYEQVLITAAVENDVPEELARRRIRIRAGAIVEDGDDD